MYLVVFFYRIFFSFFKNFILFLDFTNIVSVLPYIEVNPPQAYICSPSRTLLPPPSKYHLSGSSQCTSPKHPVSCIEPGLATHFIHDIIHISMPFSQIMPQLQRAGALLCCIARASHCGGFSCCMGSRAHGLQLQRVGSVVVVREL